MTVPLLSEQARELEAAHDSGLHRVAITTKLTEAEAATLNAYAASKGLARSEVVRDAVLGILNMRQLQDEPSPELVEIVGLRLLLINLLKPLLTAQPITLERVEAISKNAKAMKKEIATAILAGEKD